MMGDDFEKKTQEIRDALINDLLYKPDDPTEFIGFTNGKDNEKMKERYSHEIHPLIKLLLGVTRTDKGYIEFYWGYISFDIGNGPCIKVDHTYEDGVPQLCLCLYWLRINVEMPFLPWRYSDVNHSPQWGVEYHDYTVRFHHGINNKTWYTPWNPTHVSHKVYSGGDWVPAAKNEYSAPYSDQRDVLTAPYTYMLKSGVIQSRIATVYKERREWRMKWLTWCPWFADVSVAISVTFSDEVGERTGSWKGGCTGCSYEMLPGEDMVDCLKRMGREREF